MKTFTQLAVATLTIIGMTGIALAQPKADPKAAPAPVPAPVKTDAKVDAKVAPVKTDAKVDPKAGAKMEMPKPPAEIDAMAKTSVGTWRCAGTETGMDGVPGKMSAVIKVKVDLDKWWISETIEARGKTGTFKMTGFATFDAGSKKWRKLSVDNSGGQMIGTSDGVKDNKLVWNMDMMNPMGAGQFRDTIDTTDPKAVKLWGEMSMDKGKTWKPVYELTCKK